MKSNRELYLSYVNEYLSIERFAIGHGLTLAEAEESIRLGRIEHEQHADSLKRYDLKSARATVEAKHSMSCVDYALMLVLVSFFIFCIIEIYKLTVS